MTVQGLKTYDLYFQNSEHRYDLSQGKLNELNLRNLNLRDVPNDYQLDLTVLTTKKKTLLQF